MCVRTASIMRLATMSSLAVALLGGCYVHREVSTTELGS